MAFWRCFQPFFVLFSRRRWIHRKKLGGLLIKIMKKMGPKRILGWFFEKILKKKSKFFKKKNFLEVVISFLDMARKKSFFFRKNFDQNFGPKFYFYFCKGIVFFQEKFNFFNFFWLFIPQRTVLDPGESDPATSPHYEGA